MKKTKRLTILVTLIFIAAFFVGFKADVAQARNTKQSFGTRKSGTLLTGKLWDIQYQIRVGPVLTTTVAHPDKPVRYVRYFSNTYLHGTTSFLSGNRQAGGAIVFAEGPPTPVTFTVIVDGKDISLLTQEVLWYLQDIQGAEALEINAQGETRSPPEAIIHVAIRPKDNKPWSEVKGENSLEVIQVESPPTSAAVTMHAFHGDFTEEDIRVEYHATVSPPFLVENQELESQQLYRVIDYVTWSSFAGFQRVMFPGMQINNYYGPAENDEPLLVNTGYTHTSLLDRQVRRFAASYLGLSSGLSNLPESTAPGTIAIYLIPLDIPWYLVEDKEDVIQEYPEVIRGKGNDRESPPGNNSPRKEKEKESEPPVGLT